MRFNHRVIDDKMFTNARPVMHLIYEATHFTSDALLRSQSSSDIWNSILRLWIFVYMGPPYFLAVDQGSAYVSKEMKEALGDSGVTLDEAPIETPGGNWNL